jgi:ABC-type transport system involved in multi-copper enzyme maturation permease subunit
VSPASEIALVAGRELKKSIRSIKGIILAILTLLGSILAVLICIALESGVRKDVGESNTEAFRQLYEDGMVKSGTDPAVASYVAHMPISLIAFLKVLVWIGPLLVTILGFDIVSGDVQHRTIRYWTVRSRRWSYLLGKFFGLWGIVAIVTLTLTVLSSIAVLIRGYITVGDFFTWGIRCWLIAVAIAAAWAAVATFISSRFKTPLYGLLTTCGAFFCMWMAGAIGTVVRWLTAISVASSKDPHGSETARAVVNNIHWYEYLNPNGYDDLLLSPKPLNVAAGVGACAIYVIVFVGLATVLFAKKDV